MLLQIHLIGFIKLLNVNAFLHKQIFKKCCRLGYSLMSFVIVQSKSLSLKRCLSLALTLPINIYLIFHQKASALLISIYSSIVRPTEHPFVYRSQIA